jgi:chemotaxis methyl-accepting protein methylase
MQYIHTLPTSTSFRGKGLFGYAFGPLKEKNVEILYIESEKGHDTFFVSKRVTRIYYVIAGSGSFTIDGCRYSVSPGMLVEVPPRLEYSYSGHMTLLALCYPRWSRGNDTNTKWNPDVVGVDSDYGVDGRSGLARLVGIRIFGKSPTNAYLRLSQRLWEALPSPLAALRPVDSYGQFLHRLARIQCLRAQAFSTFFLRNRPQLELMGRLLNAEHRSDRLSVTVLGCSAGAEAYSVAWKIKSVLPAGRIVFHAMDISRDAVEFAKRGQYSLRAKPTGTEMRDCLGAGRWLLPQSNSELTGSEVFERMTTVEMDEFFDRRGDVAVVKDWIKEGINWHVGDVREPGILEDLGPQDVVVASNFLCHMEDAEAERCLRNIARLVKPGGYLFVSGIDLDVRTKVARDLGWRPVEDLLEEIHEGDPCLRNQWPCQYSGLEPLNKGKRDWKTRYAAAFQLLPVKTAAPMPQVDEFCEDGRAVRPQTV